LTAIKLNVAKIGSPVGLKGEVKMKLFTDAPNLRFAAGKKLLIEAPRYSPEFMDTGLPVDEVTVRSSRIQKGQWIVAFNEFPDRTAVEPMRGCLLSVEVNPEAEHSTETSDEDQHQAYYYAELVGLEVQLADSSSDNQDQTIGKVTAVIPGPAQDLLEIELNDDYPTANSLAEPVLIPFVHQIVPEVNPQDGYLVIDPPKGLLPDAN
jgi:16S rRNA processing protein RimM